MATDPGHCSRCCSSCLSSTGKHDSFRKVKRKLDATESEVEQQQQQTGDVLARVEVENECHLLRETLASQQATIQDLYEELDEERNASSSAANEAMSMILRLQREKAEIEMEARQFKRFAEERMAHDQQQVAVLEDAVYKRDLAIQALGVEVQAYRHRLLSLGVSLPHDMDPILDCPHEKEFGVDFDGNEEYPSLKCHALPSHDDLQKYVEVLDDGVTERTEDGGSCELDVLEKEVVSRNSPSRHFRRLSAESSTKFVSREASREHYGGGDHGKRHEGFPDVVVDHASDVDDVCERVCTIDAVYGATPPSNNVSSSTGSGTTPTNNANTNGSDIKNLYMRLRALEADREALKQTLVSLRTANTQNAQLVLLREIAQNLSKGAAQHESERKLARKQPLLGGFLSTWLFKWLATFVFWRKKPNYCKYKFGIPSTSIGLLLLLENSQHFQQLKGLERSRN